MTSAKALSYVDFDLLIEGGGGQYRAHVLNSVIGNADVLFQNPFLDIELENFYLRLGITRQGQRRTDSPEMEEVRKFGKRLFDTVFKDDVLTAWCTAQNQAAADGKGLRIRLRLDAGELGGLPWEYLYNQPLNRFLSLGCDTPLVRFLDLPQTPLVRPIQSPLRMLVIISSPNDYPRIDVEREWCQIRDALSKPMAAGLVQLERLEHANLPALQHRLRHGGDVHILHFIGHGFYDKTHQDGKLLFEDEYGHGRLTSGEDLGLILHNHPSLCLGLNACEGARTSPEDPFAGVAQSVIQQGIQAAVAMQFSITDNAAIVFAREFYSVLAAGYSLDEALVEARLALYHLGNIEWGTPVYFSRAEAEQVFEIHGHSLSTSHSVTDKDSPIQRAAPKKRWAFVVFLALSVGLTLLVLGIGWLTGLWTGLEARQTPASVGAQGSRSTARVTRLPKPAATLTIARPTDTVTASPPLVATYKPLGLAASTPTDTVTVMPTNTATATSTGTATATPSATATIRPLDTATTRPSDTATAMPAVIATIKPPDTAIPRPPDTAIPTDIPIPTPTPTLGPWIRSKDGMVMLHIPAGDFLMGPAEGNNIAYVNAYWIDLTEVTNAMFQKFVNDTGYQTEAEKRGSANVYNLSTKMLEDTLGANWSHPRGPDSNLDGLDNYPVVQIAREDAIAYCEWAEGSLPTDAQWEKAARGTDGRNYPWGNNFYPSNLNFCDINCPLGNIAETAANDQFQFTAPVGSFPSGASPYGILDMAGNVWEWGLDWYDETYEYRVLRGGSWDDTRGDVQTFVRYRVLPDGSGSTGFRCAR